jgi:hypothetical protein
MKNTVLLTKDLNDLEINDHIISTCGSHMRYYIVLEKPRLSKTTYYNGKARYIAVKCRAVIEVETKVGYSGRNYILKKHLFKCPQDNDDVVKVDLNYKEIVIINR